MRRVSIAVAQLGAQASTHRNASIPLRQSVQEFTVIFSSVWWGRLAISLLPSACGRVTPDAGSGLIDTRSGGALARGEPLTKRAGQLKGADSTLVSAEQMELNRLRA